MVAGFRLKHSRSWMSRLRAIRASRRAATASVPSAAVASEIRWTRTSQSAGTQSRGFRLAMVKNPPCVPPPGGPQTGSRASPAPPAAARMTTNQAGTFQNTSRVKATSARPKSAGLKIALVHTGL